MRVLSDFSVQFLNLTIHIHSLRLNLYYPKERRWRRKQLLFCNVPFPLVSLIFQEQKAAVGKKGQHEPVEVWTPAQVTGKSQV